MKQIKDNLRIVLEDMAERDDELKVAMQSRSVDDCLSAIGHTIQGMIGKRNAMIGFITENIIPCAEYWYKSDMAEQEQMQKLLDGAFEELGFDTSEPAEPAKAKPKTKRKVKDDPKVIEEPMPEVIELSNDIDFD